MSGGWRAESTGGGSRPGNARASLRVRRAIGLVITTVVAVAVAVLLFKLLGGQVAPVRLVSVGMTANHPAFPSRQVARTTAAAFGELHRNNQKQFPSSPDVSGADLHGERLLPALVGQGGASSDQTLVVYLNCLGGLMIEGDSPTAQLLTVNAEPDCLSSAKGDQLVPVALLLRELANSTTGQVLVLFDGYMAAPNWRAGILHRDFPAVLSSEATAACTEHPNLHVLCACSPGEMTSVMDETLPARYALGHFAIEGLQGKADGCRMDTLTDAIDCDAPTNQRVSISELVAFLKKQVNDWSGTQLKVAQTVQYFGTAFESDSEIVEVTTVSLADAIHERAEAAGKSEGDESGSEADGKSDSGDKDGADMKPAESSSEKAESASGAEGADESGASKSETNTDSETDGKAEPKSESADSNSEAALAELKSKMDGHSQTLDAAWTERDRLRALDQPTIHSPREWRRLNYLLVRAQEQIRLGEDESVERELNRIGELQNSIVKRGQTQMGRFDGPLRTTSLAALSNSSATKNIAATSDPSSETAAPPSDAGTEPSPTDDAAVVAAQAAEMEAFEAQWPIISAEAPEAEPVAAFRKLYDKSATVRAEFFGRVFQHALDSDLAAQGTFASLNSLLEFCQPVPSATGLEPVPVELVLLRRLCRTGAGVPAETLAEYAKLCRETLILRRQFEATVLEAVQVYDTVKPATKEWERRIAGAERWLWLGAAGMPQARHWLDQATALAAEFQEVFLPVATDAARLQSELLCELPAYARWFAGTVDVGEATGRSRLKILAGLFAELEWANEPFPAEVFDWVPAGRETKLLHLMDLTRRIGQILDARPIDLDALRAAIGGKSDAASSENLAALVSEASGLWESGGSSFRVGLRDEFETLANEVASTSTRARVLAALDVPWIPLALRKKLQTQLRVTTQSGFTEARGISKANEDHGEWQAFWCLQTLCLRGLSPSDSDTAWKKLQELANAGISESLVIKGVEAGLHLTGLWSQMAADLDRYEAPISSTDANSASAFPLAFCTHPSDTIRSEATDPIHTRNAATLAELAADRALAWHLRHDGFEDLDGASQIAGAWSRLASNLSPSGNYPQLGEVVSSIRLQSAAGSPLDAPIQAGADQQRLVNLIFESEIVLTVENGQPIAAAGIQLDPAVRNQTKTVQVNLPEDAPSRPQALLVSLRDRHDGFPWDIRLVQVHPPLDASDWRLAFVTPAEVSAISGMQPGDPLPVGVRDRNLDIENFPGDVNLRLPPNIKAADLKPILLPPLGTSVSTVEIAVWKSDSDRKPTGNPLTVISNVMISDDGRPVPLELPGPSTAAPPPATPPPAAGTPPDLPMIDVTSGLIFEVRIPNEKPIQHLIRPSVRDARDLASRPTVEFSGGLLSVTLRRNASISDSLIPDELPVSLTLPEELMRLNPTQTQLVRDISSDASVRLSAQFTDLSEIERNEFPLFLSVAGVPHAFAWYVRHPNQVRSLNGELRLEAPVDGATFQQGEPVRVKFGVYSRELEQSSGQGRWKLECRDQTVGLSGDPRKSKIVSIDREHAHQIRLALVEGVWRFQTQSDDHSIEISTVGRTGVFEVRAKLVPPSGERRGQFEKKLTFGVDDKIKPPFSPVLADTPGLVKKGKIVQFLVNGQDLKLNVDVEDLEAGVRKVLWGFDKDGDGKLGDNEVISTKELPDLRTGKRREQLVITADNLPEKAGRAVLLVSASDGLGTQCRQPLAIDLELKIPIELSTLILKLQNLTGARRNRIGKVVVKGVDGKSQTLTQDRLNGTITLKIVPGTYTITAGNKTFETKAVVEKEAATEYMIDASAF